MQHIIFDCVAAVTPVNTGLATLCNTLNTIFGKSYIKLYVLNYNKNVYIRPYREILHSGVDSVDSVARLSATRLSAIGHSVA